MVSEDTEVVQKFVTVLIVEDEAVSRTALASLLRAQGYRTESVASAEEALSLLQQHDEGDWSAAHVVALVDLDLPGMNGLQLLEKIWQDYPGMPAVMITAANRERLRAIADRGVPHLRKPLDFNQLLSILAEHSHETD